MSKRKRQATREYQPDEDFLLPKNEYLQYPLLTSVSMWYRCNQCEYAWSQANNLRRHMKKRRRQLGHLQTYSPIQTYWPIVMKIPRYISTSATSVSVFHLRQTIWGDIWKRGGDRPTGNTRNTNLLTVSDWLWWQFRQGGGKGIRYFLSQNWTFGWNVDKDPIQPQIQWIQRRQHIHPKWNYLVYT